MLRPQWGARGAKPARIHAAPCHSAGPECSCLPVKCSCPARAAARGGRAPCTPRPAIHYPHLYGWLCKGIRERPIFHFAPWKPGAIERVRTSETRQKLRNLARYLWVMDSRPGRCPWIPNGCCLRWRAWRACLWYAETLCSPARHDVITFI